MAWNYFNLAGVLGRTDESNLVVLTLGDVKMKAHWTLGALKMKVGWN